MSVAGDLNKLALRIDALSEQAERMAVKKSTGTEFKELLPELQLAIARARVESLRAKVTKGRLAATQALGDDLKLANLRREANRRG